MKDALCNERISETLARSGRVVDIAVATAMNQLEGGDDLVARILPQVHGIVRFLALFE